MHGELVFDIAWCCQPHWMGHGQHLNLKWIWLDGLDFINYISVNNVYVKYIFIYPCSQNYVYFRIQLFFPWVTDPKFNDFSIFTNFKNFSWNSMIFPWSCNRSEFQWFFKSCGNPDLNQGDLHLWSKFGDPSFNGWWVNMVRTSLKWDKFGVLS